MKTITVETLVNRDLETVWIKWTDPESIVHWNQASSDWYCPKAINNLIVGGQFSYTMAAKDGSMSFDFGGTYTKIVPHQTIQSTLGDDRKIIVNFEKIDDQNTKITETFDMENSNSEELQRHGWQAILVSFKRYCEQ